MVKIWPFEGLDPGGYDVVCLDPPWRFKSNSVEKPGRNPMRHYPVMTLAEIAALPVGDLIGERSAVVMWITSPLLAIGAHLPIFKAYGVKPSGVFLTWIKLNKRATSLFFMGSDISMGSGFTTRKNAEFCLLGTRGKSLRLDKGVHEVIVSPKREHSQKPPEFRERVRKYFGAEARICELFAREPWHGADVWGNDPNHFPTKGVQADGIQAAGKTIRGTA